VKVSNNKPKKDVKMFKSKMLALRIVMKPATDAKVDGRRTKNPGTYIDFVKGKYNTSDPAEVSAILNYMKLHPSTISMVSRNKIEAHKAALKKAKEIVEKEKGAENFDPEAMAEAEAEIAKEEEAAAESNTTPSTDEHGKTKEENTNPGLAQAEDMRKNLMEVKMSDLKKMADQNKITLVGKESTVKAALVDRLVKELFRPDSPDLGN
jgi:hypothetical protein